MGFYFNKVPDGYSNVAGTSTGASEWGGFEIEIGQCLVLGQPGPASGMMMAARSCSLGAISG